MNKIRKLTNVQKVALGNAVIAQMERRAPAMRLEKSSAYGREITAPNFVMPPPCVLAACRIATGTYSPSIGVHRGQTPIDAKQTGACVGKASTWGAVLNKATPEVAELERKHPGLRELRKRLSVLAEPELAAGKRIEENFDKSNPTSQDQISYSKGRYEGSQVVVTETGEVRYDSTIGEDVCEMVWLYWQDIIKFQKSIPDLFKFLKEVQVEGLTLANLTGICREIGLKLKGRGRPAR